MAGFGRNIAEQMSRLEFAVTRVALAVEDMQLRNRHMEMRLMNDNMKPHELVRQLVRILDEFNVEGDGSWPLRSSGFPKGFFRVAYGFPKVFLSLFFEWLPKVYLVVS